MLSPSPHYRAVYAYPWDLAPNRGSGFGELVSAQGISAVTLALSYHAGKLISSRRKHVYFPEDGAVYFNPTVSRYGRIKPHPHPDQELRRVAAHLVDSSGLDLHAWMVLFHNDRLSPGASK